MWRDPNTPEAGLFDGFSYDAGCHCLVNDLRQFVFRRSRSPHWQRNCHTNRKKCTGYNLRTREAGRHRVDYLTVRCKHICISAP